MPIHDDGNRLVIDGDLNRPAQVGYFGRSCDRIIRERHHTEVVVSVHEMDRTFPNVEVPIAAIVDHHRRRGVHFLLDTDLEGGIVGAFDPLPFRTDTVAPRLSRIWRFDAAAATPLADALALEVAERIVFGEGVQPAFTWCLHEVMANAHPARPR